MKIEHGQTGREGSFFIEENGNKLAMLNYKMTGDIMNIIHTEVDPSQRGKNIGHQLVEAAVIFVRNNKLKIKPMCSFAESVFADEFKDVLT